MSTKSFKAGDPVEWKTPQGKTEGTVVRKLTHTDKVKGHTAKATPEAPQYEVRSAKSGASAIHKPESLKKKGG